MFQQLLTKINNLQAQIDTIQLTPGPQGDPGPTGSPGPAGAPGVSYSPIVGPNAEVLYTECGDTITYHNAGIIIFDTNQSAHPSSYVVQNEGIHTISVLWELQNGATGAIRMNGVNVHLITTDFQAFHNPFTIDADIGDVFDFAKVGNTGQLILHDAFTDVSKPISEFTIKF